MRTTALLAALAIVALPNLAFAQNTTAPTKKDGPVDVYTFPDDKLLTPLGGDHGLIITGPPKPVRILLTRPRVQFIPELLKTIESL